MTLHFLAYTNLVQDTVFASVLLTMEQGGLIAYS